MRVRSDSCNLVKLRGRKKILHLIKTSSSFFTHQRDAKYEACNMQVVRKEHLQALPTLDNVLRRTCDLLPSKSLLSILNVLLITRGTVSSLQEGQLDQEGLAHNESCRQWHSWYSPLRSRDQRWRDQLHLWSSSPRCSTVGRTWSALSTALHPGLAKHILTKYAKNIFHHKFCQIFFASKEPNFLTKNKKNTKKNLPCPGHHPY